MSALVLATGAKKSRPLLLGAIFQRGHQNCIPEWNSFQSSPKIIWNFPLEILACVFLRKSIPHCCKIEACQHQIDLIPKRPIPFALLPVLEPELIRFTVTSFQLHNRGSPNSGLQLQSQVSKFGSPRVNTGCMNNQGWPTSPPSLQRAINGSLLWAGVLIPQTLPAGKSWCYASVMCCPRFDE